MARTHNKGSDRMHSRVFVPTHITGFFEIREHSQPLRHGSRGAGVNLDQGVLTRSEITEGEGLINVQTTGHEDTNHSVITDKTLEIIKRQFPVLIDLEGLNLNGRGWERIDIQIQHEVQLPIGSGYGVSAATALGTSLTLSQLLQLPITFNQAASLAHLAEVELNSGLGDVIAETCGGLAVRIKEGAPGYGVVDRLLTGISGSSNDELFILSKTLGKIETAEVITHPHHKKMINKVGSLLLNQLLQNPTPVEFMKLSLRFARETRLMDPEIKEIVDILNEETMGASMAMLGKTVFALSKDPDTSLEGVSVARIHPYGCKFL